MLKKNKKLISKLLVVSMFTSLVSTTLVFAEESNSVQTFSQIESVVAPVILNKQKLTLAPGDTTLLTATVSPTDNLTWKSSDSKVATVDSNGLIKAICLGATMITCAATDISGSSANCLVISRGIADASIDLESNPSTGYTWQYQVANAGIIQEAANTFVSPDYPPDWCGGGGTQVWVFKGLKEGSTVATFKYLRPWSGETADTKTLLFSVDKSLKVTVQEILCGEALGDINSDSNINALDFALFKKYILDNSTKIDKNMADLNRDAKVDVIDLVLLKKQLLNS